MKLFSKFVAGLIPLAFTGGVSAALIGAPTAQADTSQTRQATELAAQAPCSAFVLCGSEQYAGLVDVRFAQGVEHAACGEDNGEEDDDPLTAP